MFSHWLTGIHRIRMDVANPLLWDLGWLALFGLVPLAIGRWMKRRYPRQVSIAHRRTGARGAIAFLGGLTLAAGWWAALPPAGTQDSRTTTVVLRPDMPAARLLSAMGGNTRILWSDPAGSVWVLARDDAASPLHYYRHGALYVSGSVLPAGCSGWIRT